MPGQAGHDNGRGWDDDGKAGMTMEEANGFTVC